MATKTNVENILNAMSGFPAASTTAVATERVGAYISRAYGNTVPPKGTAGYCRGAQFLHADGASETDLWYTNQGDETSSYFTADTLTAA